MRLWRPVGAVGHPCVSTQTCSSGGKRLGPDLACAGLQPSLPRASASSLPTCTGPSCTVPCLGFGREGGKAGTAGRKPCSSQVGSQGLILETALGGVSLRTHFIKEEPLILAPRVLCLGLRCPGRPVTGKDSAGEGVVGSGLRPPSAPPGASGVLSSTWRPRAESREENTNARRV